MNAVECTVVDVEDLRPDEVVALYDSVGWSAYTKRPDVLMAALAGSTAILAAREDNLLIGLARVVSDGASICYLQDIIVHPEHQRRGIGRELVRRILEPYAEVRQKVLLTDDDAAQREFYESLGFQLVQDPLRAFARFD